MVASVTFWDFSPQRQPMKFVIATLSLLVLVFLLSGTIVVVAGVLTPQVFTAAVN